MSINDSIEGVSMEEKIREIIHNGETVDALEEPIFTKPSQGVVYGTDIRGDKWDHAIEINDKINNSIDKIRAMKIVKKEEKEEREEGAEEAK